MFEKTVFIPGKGSIYTGLLSRYLPPIPEGIVSTWLKEHVQRGSWVLDPFASNPWLTVEIARAGYKTLVAANNPINRFLIELAAHPPSRNEIQSALAELAAARSGEERLESHLNKLYLTKCPGCGLSLPARAFLWEKDARQPFARILECEQCGENGEFELSEEDLQLLSQFQRSGLHRARALERIAPFGDPDRVNAEEALNVYLPRAIYALVTLINRLEGLISVSPQDHDNPARLRCLWALALNAFDQGNVLWSHPSSRPRPRSLSASPRFRENNIWYALESTIHQFTDETIPVPIFRWQEFPDFEYGIVIFEGPLRDLNLAYRLLPSGRVPLTAVIAAVPRPNQAFWTLSALWAGWLWGREAVGPFRSVLRRRRYDWNWHCTALTAGFSALGQLVSQETPILGLIPEAEANFLTASLVASYLAGFILRGVAMRSDGMFAQVLWRSKHSRSETLPNVDTRFDRTRAQKQIVTWVKGYLRERGEPADYLSIHTGSLSDLISNNVIPPDRQDVGNTYSKTDLLLKESFTYKFGFLRFGGGEKSPETGMFWHNEITDPAESLMDRIETAFLNTLIARKEITRFHLERLLCDQFPGFFTPPSDLIVACIRSYCDEESSSNGLLRLRQEDQPESRKTDLMDIHENIASLGTKLGLQVSGNQPTLWQDHHGDIILAFYIITDARISKIIKHSTLLPQISVIVIPGARANLILYKLQHDPLLRMKIAAGWRFVKFRHLRSLTLSPLISPINIHEMLDSDPLTEAPAQLRLL